MNLIEWEDKYSVKIKHIDEQHKKLVGMINELHNAMTKGQGKLVIDGILKKMTAYTVQHFKSEEVLFDQYGYPAAEKHKAEHASFVEKVTDFYGKFEAGKLFLSIEVMDFLSDWLVTHIVGSDKQYSAFLNSKGVD